MPDEIRRPDQDEEFEDTNEGAERGIRESDDEFDDEDDLDEDEEDEDLDSPRGAAGRRRSTRLQDRTDE